MARKIWFWLRQALLGLLCAAAVFTGGAYLAQKCSQQILELPLVQRLLTPREEMDSLQRALTDKNTDTLLRKYLVALLDATIQFEELPSYQVQIPLALIQVVPNDTQVQGFDIQGKTIRMDCVSADYPSQKFLRALQGEDAIRTARLERISQREDGSWNFTVSVTAG